MDAELWVHPSPEGHNQEGSSGSQPSAWDQLTSLQAERGSGILCSPGYLGDGVFSLPFFHIL